MDFVTAEYFSEELLNDVMEEMGFGDDLTRDITTDSIQAIIHGNPIDQAIDIICSQTMNVITLEFDKDKSI